jgi:hypothetical protein
MGDLNEQQSFPGESDEPHDPRVYLEIKDPGDIPDAVKDTIREILENYGMVALKNGANLRDFTVESGTLFVGQNCTVETVDGSGAQVTVQGTVENFADGELWLRSTGTVTNATGGFIHKRPGVGTVTNNTGATLLGPADRRPAPPAPPGVHDVD